MTKYWWIGLAKLGLFIIHHKCLTRFYLFLVYDLDFCPFAAGKIFSRSFSIRSIHSLRTYRINSTTVEWVELFYVMKNHLQIEPTDNIILTRHTIIYWRDNPKYHFRTKLYKYVSEPNSMRLYRKTIFNVSH